MKQKLLITVLPILLLWLTNCVVHASSLQLSQEEQAWLEEHKSIRLSGPLAFPPFQYVDSDGAFQGMASDYIFHIAEMVGLKIEVIKDLAWPEVLKRVEHKEIDVLSCAAITPERSIYLNYSTPHLSFPLVIVSRKNAPYINDIRSLHGKRIVFVEKNVTYDLMKQEGIDFDAQFVKSPLEALKEVSFRHADAAIENLAAASYLIEKNGLANLKIAAPTSLDNYSLSIAVRKDWPELVSIINKGLAAISQEKHDEIRQRWITVRYEHGISVQDIVKWVLLVSGVAVILLAAFFLWNRKLSREIRERKRAELEKEKLISELTNALDEIKTLRGILPICSECKKIRDDKGYWRQIEAYVEEHSEADFSHGVCPDCIKKLYGEEDWFKNIQDNLDRKSA